MSCKCCESKADETISIPCPMCNNQGEVVSMETVESLKMDTVNLLDENYFICKDSQCKVVYYSGHQKLNTEDVKVPVWFKESSALKILCYCSNITTQDIDKAYSNNPELKLKDVFAEFKKAEKCDCLHNNPTGNCCHEVIESYIKALRQ